MTTATKAAHDGAAATNAAFSLVAETFAIALGQTTTVAEELVADAAVGIESVAETARELLSGGFAVATKRVAGLGVDAYQRVVTQQLDFSVMVADAVKVDWVSQVTHRNATAIGELVAVSTGAARELLR